MSEYEKPYKILFNAITDALNEEDAKKARIILTMAQIEAEEAFISFNEEQK